MTRPWNRSANGTGNRERDELIQQTLQKKWPPSEVPANIEVVGNGSSIKIHIWNNQGVNIWDVARPEDFLTSPDGETFTAVISKVTELLNVSLVA